MNAPNKSLFHYGHIHETCGRVHRDYARANWKQILRFAIASDDDTWERKEVKVWYEKHKVPASLFFSGDLKGYRNPWCVVAHHIATVMEELTFDSPWNYAH